MPIKLYDENWNGGIVPLEYDKTSSTFMGEVDFELIGRRVRERRNRLGLSTSELAIRAKLSRQTVSKIEEGVPTKKPTLRRIQFVLGLYWEDLVRPDEVTDFACLSRAQDHSWKSAYSKERYTKVKVEESNPLTDTPEERKRLGSLGLQPFFSMVLANQLPNGTMHSPGLMELHRPSWIDKHPGEELVYCLRGTVKIIVRNEEFLVQKGDCLLFNAFEEHKYVPVAPDEDGQVPLIFIVLAVSPQDAEKGIRTWPSDEEIELLRSQSQLPHVEEATTETN